MRFRLASAAVLAAVLTAPVSAQDFQRPDDWEVRFDQPGASEDQLEMFVSMPPGWHVTSGPAAIYWDPAHEASGSYRVEMEVFLFDPGERREAFGIFIGGRDLNGPDQAYAYFLIRNGGQFIVKERAGADAPTVEPWTSHEAILSYADRGEDTSVLNVLAVEVDGDALRFLVNDREVWSGSTHDLPVDGVYGFRVNHGLNLHVSRLEAVPLH
jgi:hypothetical protein